MLNRLNQSEGNWRADIGDYVTSIRLHKKVIENLPETDSINLSIAFNNLGYAQLSMGLYDIARVSILKAISYNEYLDDAYNNLGDFYLNQKKYSTALKNYNLAIGHDLEDQPLKHNDWLPSLNDVELAVNKQSLLNHLVTKANAWLTWYEHEPDPEHLEHALETFDLADQLVDLIRFESTEQQSKLYWREKGASLYLKAVEVCYLLNLPEKAFYFMERNKALLLLEDLGHEEAKRIAGLPLEAAQNEFKLRRQIFLAENDLSEAGRDEVLKDLKNAVRLAKTNYEDFIDSLNTAYPDYARYKRKIDILSFDDLRLKYLSADQFVLHYILNKEDGYGLVNTKDSSKLFRLANIEQLNKDVGNYIQLLSSGISDLRTFNDLSHKLYQELVPEEIRGRLKGKRLLIVPDYNLQRIPFETLVSDISGPAYLLEDAEISYAYSLSLLERQSANIRKFNAPVIAMAPVKFGEEGLNTLKYSEAEAMAISDLFKGDLYLNEQASKSNFTQSAGGHKIIHLATHADLGNGENPWIAFSDGKLTLKEIYATPTQSEMVVLSACNTSQGDLKPGEGIMSLARGFFYSGANSVVSSLWPITDKGGREIMQEFYENLNKGDSKSAALRKAKLSYLQHTEVPELKHPYYWAGFVILGDNAPLVETSSAHWILIALAVILGLLFFGRRLLKLRQ
jgi:CHAT domain-containing protein